MNNQQALKKIALAALLTAMSVAIDVLFKRILGLENFGVPFYAIPIVYGSIILGPFYGVIMSVIADGFGVLIAGNGYLPLFVLAPIIWGLLPGLMNYKSVKRLSVLALSLLLTYVLASAVNTYAIYYYFGYESAMATILARVLLIPVNTILLFYVIKALDRKLRPISDRFMNMDIQAKNKI